MSLKLEEFDLIRGIGKRFWSKVEWTPTCWLWIGATPTKWKRHQYGHFSVKHNAKHKVITAHRFSYLWVHGEIEGGRCVLHTCDNPLCVNPMHLWLGTFKDNTHDIIQKGRDGREKRGVLTRENVKHIWMDYKAGRTQYEIAEKYNVTQPTVWAILNKKTWGHLTKDWG